MQQHKLKQRILSLILMLAMVFTLIPSSVFGADINQGGETDVGGGTAGWVWNGNQQFIRASIFFAEGGNWETGKVEQIGYTVDLAHPKTAKAKAVAVHGNFLGKGNTANIYTTKGVSALDLGNHGNYDNFYRTYADNETGGPSIPTGTYDPNTDKFTPDGGTMEFPILTGDKGNGIDAKAFFEQYKAWNALLWYTQHAKYDTQENAIAQGKSWQGAKNMAKGEFKTPKGTIQYGQYIIVLESGLFATVNNQYAALTVREAVLLKDSGSNIFSKISTPFMNLANRLYIKEQWPMMGLDGTVSPDQLSGKSWVGKYHDQILKKFGVGIVPFTKVEKPAMPVMKYFYDFTTGTVEKIDSTAYFDKAVNIKEEPSNGTYTAVAKDSVKEGEPAEYTLYGASVSSKSEIKGNLHQVDAVNPETGAKGKSTQFLNAVDKSNKFTAEASKRVLEKYTDDGIVGYIKSLPIIATSDVKNWGTANAFVTTLSQASKASGLKTKDEIMKFNSDGTLTFNAGTGGEDLQLSLIYVKEVPNKPDEVIPEIPVKTVDPSDPPIEIFRKGNTTVTKQYYDEPTSTVPSKITTETIPKESTYTIKDEEPYKVKEWVIVDDKTPGQPEDYKDWETVKENESPAGKSGTTTGDLGPSNWVDPDRELFIKVVKDKEEEQPPLETDLRLTEKRISWLKSLSDIGGIPTIVFQWNAITGHESHKCGSKHCSGHSCNERIGADSFLRFVSSNTTSVKSSIMGNTTNFMPYDVDNVHEFNRGNSGGTYDMHPNYGYVIWRGQDIPTIASYKYGDTTGNGVAPDAPVIKGLIGETQVGISGKETRKSDKNNSFYMDDFTITEGKSNYDTGNLTA